MSTLYSIPCFAGADLIDSVIAHPDIVRDLTAMLKSGTPAQVSLWGIPIVEDRLMPDDRIVVRSKHGQITIVNIGKQESP